jgi:hypothetical protein
MTCELRFIRSRFGRGLFILAAFGLSATLAASAHAQETLDAASSAVAVSGGVDLTTHYMFRGVRQNSTGIVVWPSAALAARVLASDGVVKRVDAKVGFWNSLNTGDTGSDGPAGRLWYESRVSASLAVQFSGRVSVTAGYTAYISPNDMFSTVKEIGVTVSVDDGPARSGVRLNPYASLAFEVGASPGAGQLDGGLRSGRYLELGAIPEVPAKRIAVSFPVKTGLSLRDYYELGDHDNAFGFFSVGGIVTVPFGRASKVGAWNVHGGVEFQSLGETTKVFNGGDRSFVIASVGIGFRR